MLKSLGWFSRKTGDRGGGSAATAVETSAPEIQPYAHQDVRAIRVDVGRVIKGHILIDGEALAGKAAELSLWVNGSIVATAAAVTNEIGALTFRLRKSVEDLPQLIDDVSVTGTIDGAPCEITFGDAYLLDRVVVKTDLEFENNVHRRVKRVKHAETMAFAARQGMRRFPSDLPKQAVAVAVLGYRIVEVPEVATPEILEEISERAEELITQINPEDPADARWLSSLNALLFNLFATQRQIDKAVPALMRLFDNRALILVEPICAYNAMIGIAALGHFYHLQGRRGEARLAWSQYINAFTNAAYLTPKRLGTMVEFKHVLECAIFCASGLQGQQSTDHSRLKTRTDEEIARLLLRTKSEESIAAMVEFFRDIEQNRRALPKLSSAYTNLIHSPPPDLY